MDITAILAGFFCLVIGGLFILFIVARKQHTEELFRLEKHSHKMAAREAAKSDGLEDIFLKQRTDYLGKILTQAGLESQYDTMKKNWILSIVLTPVCLVLFAIFKAPDLIVFAVLFGAPLGAFGFFLYIKWVAKHRQAKMTAQLPQILETMVSSLKAGSPIVECFKILAETAPEPIGTEFKRSLISFQLGKPFREVMAEMAMRIHTPDFKLLTQAIFISQDVGANLADVVATIADSIRERFKLRDFMASLTAQGKATAVFIGCLPYFITGMTYMIAPSYITPFLNHPVCRIISIALVLWELLGFYVLIRLCTFEV